MKVEGLNIVSFNVPYPPNYGGIIDVYYKIMALNGLGCDVVLHCYEYERPAAPELEKLCSKVYYYKRRTGIFPNFSFKPYNVVGRNSEELVRNLLKNDYPILYEGLISCHSISHPLLKDRVKVYREANIEHDYFHHLAVAETNYIKKLFFEIESRRMRAYEKELRHASLIAAISSADADELRERYPEVPVEFIPCFSANAEMEIDPETLPVVLYHAKLSVPENNRAALYLIKKVFPYLNCRCIVAGMEPGSKLLSEAQKVPNVTVEVNPSQERMRKLMSRAQITLLTTFQATGLKLKLLGSLFAGKHIVANSKMVHGSGLDAVVHIADTAEQQIEVCNSLINVPFTDADLNRRRQALIPCYENTAIAQRLLDAIARVS